MSEKTRLVVGLGDLLGCGYYRCALPYKALSKKGFDVLLTNKLDFALGPNDVLVLQRQHGEGILSITEAFKKQGGKLVFELDDYFHDLPPNNPARLAYPKGGPQLKNMEKFMGLSDLLTVSTPGLADNYSKFANNVKICYNVIDDEQFENPLVGFRMERDSDEFRLGWAGSATHHDDFITIIKPVTEIMREFKNVKFIFIGQDYKNLFPYDIKNRMEHAGHTFPMHKGKALFYNPEGTNSVIQYYELLTKSQLDAAIAPILPVSFNRAKSYIKLLEYGLCNIPYIATKYGPYSQYTGVYSWYDREKQVGLTAETNSEWKRNLKELIANPNLRNNLIENNKNNIINHHTIRTGVNQWLEALASIGLEPTGEPGHYEEKIVKM